MPVEQPPFNGFAADHFSFFRDLEHNNTKEWFEKNRQRYTAVTSTFRSLLVALEPSVLALNPQFETTGKTNQNFSRINRDIRFQAGREPYNPNYYLYCYDRRRGRKSDGRLYVSVSARSLNIGFSIYSEDKNGSLRKIFRPRLESELPLLQRWLALYVTRKRYDCYWYTITKRKWTRIEGLPKLEEDWERLEGLVVRKVLRPGHPGIYSASLAHEIELTFDRLYPLYAFTSIEGNAWRKHFQGVARAKAVGS